MQKRFRQRSVSYTHLVRLSELLGQEVKFAADPEVVGTNAKAAVEAMKDGDVILLENTRYRAEETKKDVYKRQHIMVWKIEDKNISAEHFIGWEEYW